ncbi:MAG: YicC family protein [Clostridia bacterium]|nr:YicC/YloC family endoribonuclease [Candidatus Pelethousia sp.]NCB30512.1 YicC family protein [Clostridia bacterium]
MVNSMTGFGRALLAREGREMTVELKSVNHRYLDMGFRMPRHIGFVEDALRGVLSKELARGHVDVYLFYRNQREDARRVYVDQTLLGEYLQAAREAGERFSLRDDVGLAAALRLPDVTDIVEAEEDREAVTNLAAEACALACTQLKAMRSVEGAKLYEDLHARCGVVEALGERIALRAPSVVEEYRQRLQERIAVLLAGVEIDPSRLAAETAIFADKASIDEELVRLRSHVAQMRAMLAGNEPAGRKLDFIVQEMNREFNTMGSKANDAQIVNLVIEGKAEIEKIREQVQNIE